MTSSGPIHHCRFPAQQGQAALLAVTTASSLAHFTLATWDTGAPHGWVENAGGEEFAG